MLFIFSTPELIRCLWHLKTVASLHWILICAVIIYHTLLCCSRDVLGQWYKTFYGRNLRIFVIS